MPTRFTHPSRGPAPCPADVPQASVDETGNEDPGSELTESVRSTPAPPDRPGGARERDKAEPGSPG